LSAAILLQIHIHDCSQGVQKLNLTADQKAKITPIVADRQQKLQALRAGTDPKRVKAQNAKAIFQDSDKQINAVLTPDQQKTYKEMEDAQVARAKARRSSKASAPAAM
jgi:Spy/CpxP family protein refolding chaperone